MAKELVYADRADLVTAANAIRQRLATDDGYKISEFEEAILAIVGEIPDLEAPSISVSNSGLITASGNGLTTTQQLSTQAAKTITPSESAQTAVDSNKYTTGTVFVAAIPGTYVGSKVTTKGATTYTPTTTDQTIAANTYLTGTQTIKGDANLVAKNIPENISIFGVSGSMRVVKFYQGTDEPLSTIGNNGDLYLVLASS